MQSEGIIDQIKKIFNKNDKRCEEIGQAGTGFMFSLVEGITAMQEKGYKANLVPKFDHLECDMGAIKLYPGDLVIDKVIRFENSSDPGDQSILYAVSSPNLDIKGIYIESYGTYHDELSEDMLERLKDHPH